MYNTKPFSRRTAFLFGFYTLIRLFQKILANALLPFWSKFLPFFIDCPMGDFQQFWQVAYSHLAPPV